MVRLISQPSNSVTVPYLINTDPVYVGYRKNPNQNRVEVPIRSLSNKVRLKVMDRAHKASKVVITREEDLKSLSKSKKYRVKSVLDGDIDSHWVEYREVEAPPLKEGKNHFRMRGFSNSFKQIKSKYAYSNILSEEFDLFSMLSDILDVALMATDQIEFAYTFIIEDLITLDLEDKYPGIIQLLDAEELKGYSLEEKVDHLESINIFDGDLKKATLREIAKYEEAKNYQLVEEFFKVRSRDMAEIIKIYSVDDDYFFDYIKDKFVFDLSYELEDLYKKIKETILPVNFHSVKGNEHHISTGDIARLRGSDNEHDIGKVFNPLLTDTYRNLIKEIVQLEGEIASMENFEYDVMESFLFDFTSSLLDIVILSHIEEVAIKEASFKRYDIATKLMPKLENISVLHTTNEIETIMYFLYDTYINILEEFEATYDVELELQDELLGITKEIFVALYQYKFEENKFYKLNEKSDMLFGPSNFILENKSIQISDGILLDKTEVQDRKDYLILKINEKILNDLTLDFLDESKDEVIMKINEFIENESTDIKLLEEDLVALVLSKATIEGEIPLVVEEKIRANIIDVLKVLSGETVYGWDRMAVRRKDAHNRMVLPNLPDHIIDQTYELDFRYIVVKEIYDRYNKPLSESVVFTTGLLDGDRPLGIFLLGLDRLGRKMLR